MAASAYLQVVIILLVQIILELVLLGLVFPKLVEELLRLFVRVAVAAWSSLIASVASHDLVLVRCQLILLLLQPLLL